VYPVVGVRIRQSTNQSLRKNQAENKPNVRDKEIQRVEKKEHRI
jgi:hypothetical protein